MSCSPSFTLTIFVLVSKFLITLCMLPPVSNLQFSYYSLHFTFHVITLFRTKRNIKHRGVLPMYKTVHVFLKQQQVYDHMNMMLHYQRYP